MRKRQTGFVPAIPILRSLPICLLFLVLRIPMLGLDPGQPLAQMYHSAWTEKDGIPGIVTGLAQTADGYLWIGGADGLFRFDGFSFDRYKPESRSLPSTAVQCLLAPSDGGRWIGYVKGGVSFLKDGQVTNYSERDSGFARLEGRRWKKIRMDWEYPSKTAYALFVDKDGTLWVDAGKRIMFLPKGEKKFQDIGLGPGRVFGFAQARDGAIWIDTEDGRHSGPFVLLSAGLDRHPAQETQRAISWSIGMAACGAPEMEWSVCQIRMDCESCPIRNLVRYRRASLRSKA